MCSCETSLFVCCVIVTSRHTCIVVFRTHAGEEPLLPRLRGSGAGGAPAAAAPAPSVLPPARARPEVDRWLSSATYGTVRGPVPVELATALGWAAPLPAEALVRQLLVLGDAAEAAAARVGGGGGGVGGVERMERHLPQLYAALSSALGFAPAAGGGGGGGAADGSGDDEDADAAASAAAAATAATAAAASAVGGPPLRDVVAVTAAQKMLGAKCVRAVGFCGSLVLV